MKKMYLGYVHDYDILQKNLMRNKLEEIEVDMNKAMRLF